MFELKGKYAEAKVFTDIVDEESISQVTTLLNQPFVEGSRIRMMPDIHAGAGCTIGTTMTITDKICPNLVGVDIGCGMETVRIEEDHIEPEKLDILIRENIPSGFMIRTAPHQFTQQIDLKKLRCANHVDINRGLLSLGTLGGGNHFIEADRDDDGHIYIVIHSGSRHLGLEIANYYQRVARVLLGDNKVETDRAIEELKKAGRQREIAAFLKELKKQKPKIPPELAYVEGETFDNYIADMKLAQEYAMLNRKAMMDVIITGLGLHIAEEFTTIHNYIDVDNHILRKGSVSAQLGEKLLIPINMRDGSLVCVGKGNEDWNFSAPHGAGRLFSRSAAKQNFTVEEFQHEMEGIYTTSVNQSTLDECPMAYKSIDDIVENIEPTVEIKAIIKPIYNFKAGE